MVEGGGLLNRYAVINRIEGSNPFLSATGGLRHWWSPPLVVSAVDMCMMKTNHKLVLGNCMTMRELADTSVHCLVTSPPYFNAPFDYKGLFKGYDQYLGVLRGFAREAYRVLQDGRIAVLNIDDMLVDGEKFPIVAEQRFFKS